MNFTARLLLISISCLTAIHANATDFAKLDEALPSNGIINNLEPVFDFDGDGCLPSAGISRSGEKMQGSIHPVKLPVAVVRGIFY